MAAFQKEEPRAAVHPEGHQHARGSATRKGPRRRR
jgi:hypothetical protein